MPAQPERAPIIKSCAEPGLAVHRGSSLTTAWWADVLGTGPEDPRVSVLLDRVPDEARGATKREERERYVCGRAGRTSDNGQRVNRGRTIAGFLMHRYHQRPR